MDETDIEMSKHKSAKYSLNITDAGLKIKITTWL